MTETGLSLGTPFYMSPEQATADKELTNRSDIYSLGSMLYEMLPRPAPASGILESLESPATRALGLRSAQGTPLVMPEVRLNHAAGLGWPSPQEVQQPGGPGLSPGHVAGLSLRVSPP